MSKAIKVTPLQQYYAVARGRSVGIFRTWDECRAQVHGFSAASFKKFRSQQEALQFIADNSGPPPPSVYRKRKSVPGEQQVVGVRVPQQQQQTLPAAKRQMSAREKYVVYCDGNTQDNGGKAALSGSGVYCEHSDVPNIAASVPGAQTNNRAELFAMSLALLHTLDKNSVLIRADSKYVLDGITNPDYLAKWKRNGWKKANKKPVLNQDLWKLVDKLLTLRAANSERDAVQFEHVPAHRGIAGNESADQLATQGMKKPRQTAESLALFPFEYSVQLEPYKEAEYVHVAAKAAQ